jgi:CubicO group peptidase (beta-lactamase class C family)
LKVIQRPSRPLAFIRSGRREIDLEGLSAAKRGYNGRTFSGGQPLPRRAWLLLILLLALSFAAPAATQAPAQPDYAAALREVDALAAGIHHKDPLGGITVGVVSGPKLIWTKSYGFANAEDKRAASAETVYRIGSITKQFTALMLLQLAEQGTVRLTDPVEKYVPELSAVPRFHPAAPPITLVQLATMSSGLAREPKGPPDHSRGPVSGWTEKVLVSLPQTVYQYEPGTQYLYSNIGYATLGVALERAAGKPFTQYVQERIVAPLGMTHTAFELTPSMRQHVARGYSRTRDGTVDWSAAERELEGRGYRVPNGALMSTVTDLARFISFELGEGPWIVKKETQDANYTRVQIADGTLSSGYGVGFQATRRGTLIALGHGGSTAGFRASALFDRASKTGVIVLRNSDLAAAGLATRALEIVAAAARTPSTEAAAGR